MGFGDLNIRCKTPFRKRLKVERKEIPLKLRCGHNCVINRLSATFRKFVVVTHAQTIALYHPLLHSIALKLVKCKADAEDIVQDTFLKWLAQEKEHIKNTKAYLIRSVTNNCLNHLDKLKRKKEEYFDNIQLPNLINKFKELDLSHLDLHIDVQAALNVLHHKLEPLERAVFVLKEGFNLDYEALQEVLEKKKDHCRQLFSRAKKKINDEAAKLNIDWNLKPQWIESFKKSCESGVSEELVQLLTREPKK